MRRFAPRCAARLELKSEGPVPWNLIAHSGGNIVLERGWKRCVSTDIRDTAIACPTGASESDSAAGRRLRFILPKACLGVRGPNFVDAGHGLGWDAVLWMATRSSAICPAARMKSG